MVNIDDVTSLIDMLLGLSNPTYSIQNSDYNMMARWTSAMSPT